MRHKMIKIERLRDEYLKVCTIIILLKFPYKVIKFNNRIIKITNRFYYKKALISDNNKFYFIIINHAIYIYL